MQTDRYQPLRDAIAAGPTPGPLYMRTNRHPETDGTPWGWVDMYPAGSMNKASPPGVNVTWRRGDRSAVNARYIIESRPDTIAALLRDNDKLREALRSLCAACVRLMESGRDRIRDLGGECDSLDAMEARDQALRAARAARADGEGQA